MKILVIGGTRYFGIHMVNELLAAGHDVTIATRGKATDSFGDKVKRIFLERTKEESVREALSGTHYDVVIDKIAYCSNDIKYVMGVVNCDKYIYMSSTSVYEPKHMGTVEEDFDGIGNELIWCDRKAFPYEQIKRQAEYALWQQYSDKKWIAVRYPFVIGRDDYTKRLLFYVEHIIKSIPMNIDNIDYQMSYIRSDEARKFLAFLVDKDFTGAINGASDGTISLKEMIEYVEEKTGAKAIIDNSGEDAPYNGEPEYSICTDKAKALGYQFTELKDWIYELLDYYIQVVEGIMIREANKNDLDEILQLYLYLHETSIPEESEQLRKTWENIVNDENHHLIICEVDGKIVASCVCVIIPNLTRNVRPYAFIENVVTHGDYRKKGYATACLDYARQIAEENHCYKMMLLTGSKEESTLNFYRNAGYNSSDKTAFIQWIDM